MKVRRNAQGFTLVEILIVVVILGILAAIVIPQFTNASEAAKGANLLSQLQTIRSQLELYQIQHNGEYPAILTDWTQMTSKTDDEGTIDPDGNFGPYLQQAPENPFISDEAGKTAVAEAEAVDVGWVWDDANKILRAVVPTATIADRAGLTGNPNVLVVGAGGEEPVAP
jgi:general secretion pathway protein G